MGRPPKVSIVIPAYNGGRYLAAALMSAVAQTYRKKEIILVDDASSDDTVAIAREFPGVKIYRNRKRRGMVANWNYSMTLARGEWIKFLHQDDHLAPDCLETMIDSADAYFDAPMIVSRRTLAFDDTVALNQREYWNKFLEFTSMARAFDVWSWFRSGEKFIRCRQVTPEWFAEFMARHAAVNAIGEPSCVMLRRRALLQIGGFNETLIQLCDWEYFARIAAWRGCIFIDRPLATYRVHAGSQTRKNGRSFRAQFLDPKVIFGEIAYAEIYENVRRAARKINIDYRDRFQRMGTIHDLR
jgi:glycosyltransferase involved in cell wall biosynthesis